jgi:hypothetical protein
VRAGFNVSGDEKNWEKCGSCAETAPSKKNEQQKITSFLIPSQ